MCRWLGGCAGEGEGGYKKISSSQTKIIPGMHTVPNKNDNINNQHLLHPRPASDLPSHLLSSSVLPTMSLSSPNYYTLMGHVASNTSEAIGQRCNQQYFIYSSNTLSLSRFQSLSRLSPVSLSPVSLQSLSLPISSLSPSLQSISVPLSLSLSLALLLSLSLSSPLPLSPSPPSV